MFAQDRLSDRTLSIFLLPLKEPTPPSFLGRTLLLPGGFLDSWRRHRARRAVYCMLAFAVGTLDSASIVGPAPRIVCTFPSYAVHSISYIDAALPIWRPCIRLSDERP
jgi:hypothetical protein